ncbi:glycoside hydrolase family 20 zincin-like fold domain-containing protein [Mariniflexile sp.]|uniref:glycoside hydrolase family 20 zincin-like fold domain-containing protein n=1 Tax=Mariniflexile sp. TaxID=1979402 RepID=UPI004048CEF6
MKKKLFKSRYVLLAITSLLFFGCAAQDKRISIYSSSNNPQVDFALEDIKSALGKNYVIINNANSKEPNILLKIEPLNDLKKEGFSIKKAKNKITVIGFDTAGLMYGSLELAEQIKLYGFEGVKEITRNPYMEMRGPKFNIPLDVRTPSYSDASDAGQKNIPVMWDFEFWKDYIDTMARYRYNYISLWSLHPFPSLVKVPGYEDIALEDVQRSTGTWKDLYNLNGIGMGTPDILDNPEIVKKITIDEKIDFWRKVMAYGKERNIDFHFITWNIFDYGTDGKYGITDKMDNDITKNYFRKSVKQLFVTYPDLAGIGLTTGENMGLQGTTEEDRENWAYDTYAKGILDAAAEMLDRKFTFIHRQHQTGAKEIAEKFKDVIDAKNIEFLYCFKYAKAHVYSATKQPYHENENFVEDIGDMKTIWGLRNDDTFYFRWGAPDFVREFIENIPHDVSKGIYFGSDQWVWGRDFLTKNPETPNQLEVVKHWYQWMLWGRLSYDPTLTNDRFSSLLADRFPNVDAQALFSAWENASMIYPITTGFHWGSLDFHWYIEGCFSHPRFAENTTEFHDVNRFITLGTHPSSGYQNIPNYVKMKVSDSTSTLKSPLAVSKELHQRADAAIENLKSLKAANNKELQYTLNDIQTVAYMGKYYAHKIAGATYVAMYRETKDNTYQQKAVDELTKALGYWEKFTKKALEQNKNPLWTNRVGIVDWKKITTWVKDDIEIAKQN